MEQLSWLDNQEEEIWKDVVGYEGLYKISNRGRLKSLGDRLGRYINQIFALKANADGYIETQITKNKTRKNYGVHRLVAKAFIPNIENKPQVNHKNGIKSDNRVENLEWCTIQENSLHSYRELGRVGAYKGRFGVLSETSKPVIQYDLLMNKIAEYESGLIAMRKTGVGHVSAACTGRQKTAGGFIWKFAQSNG